jgi:anti-sigma B factor antagonist
MNPQHRYTVDRPFAMSVERRDDAAVVRLSGACSLDVAEKMRACLVELAAAQVPLIVLEMSDLDFIESTGIGAIIAAHLKARHHRGLIRLVSPNDPIRQILSITRLTQLFPIYSDVDKALSATAH